MKYAYNGNLLEEERINVVVKEIVDKYDFISLELEIIRILKAIPFILG